MEFLCHGKMGLDAMVRLKPLGNGRQKVDIWQLVSGERETVDTILCVRLQGLSLLNDASVHIMRWGVRPEFMLMCTRGSLYL